MRESDVQAVLEALRSGWLTMGPRTAAFESEFAAYIGAAHAVAVSSGTAAVFLVVRALAPVDPVIVVHTRAAAAPIPETELPVIEDCRDALGLGVGRAGVAACWSFADGRPLAMGEGGCVTTDDHDLAARVRLLRQHAMTSNTWDRHRGHGDSYDVVDVGFNFRLDEPRAALGSAQLAHLDEDLEARRSGFDAA